MSTNLVRPPVRTRATPNITPFTYYDGATYLEILESLRAWLRDFLVPEFNDLAEYVDDEIAAALATVEDTLNAKIDEIDQMIADQNDRVDQEIADLTAYVDNAVQQIINSTIEVSDPVIAGVISDLSSASRQVVLDAVNPNTILVYAGDDDTFAWQAAVDAVIADRDSGAIAPETVITIRGMSPAYEFNGAVSFRGLTNAVIKGAAEGYATVTPAAGSGSTSIFRCQSGPFEGVTENVVFENFSVHGGLTSEAAEGVHDRRQDNVWGADRVTAFVHASGNLTEGEEAAGTVKNITVRNNIIHGVYSLPVHMRGVDGVYMTGNTISRSLDTGFTWCYGVNFTDNRVIYSADNGVSVSRGCDQCVVSNNIIEGSYYAGIHVGGFGADEGPTRISVTGNTVTNSRQYGISAIGGSRSIIISSNVVDGVLRGAPSDTDRDAMGDGAPVAYGTGIIWGGHMSGETTSSATVNTYSEDVIVTGNVVKNADRCGIMCKGGTRRSTITDNIVVNIGSRFSANGSTEISPTHAYYNIGIGIYGASRSFISNITIANNQVFDTRNDPIIGRSYFGGSVMSGNFDSGVRTPSSDALTMRGSGSVSRDISFAVGSEEPDWRITQDVNRLLRIVGNLNDTDSTALAMGRDGSVRTPNLREITGVTSNVYVDNQGELRRIT